MQTFVAGAFIVLLLAAMYRLRGVNAEEKKLRPVLLAVLIAATALRIGLAATNTGYETDINCFTAWGQIAANVGPANFYSEGFCDYPPGYLYVLGLQGLIGNLLNLTPGSAAYLVLLKLPAIASDAAICYLFYRMGCRAGKPSCPRDD